MNLAKLERANQILEELKKIKKEIKLIEHYQNSNQIVVQFGIPDIGSIATLNSWNGDNEKELSQHLVKTARDFLKERYERLNKEFLEL